MAQESQESRDSESMSAVERSRVVAAPASENISSDDTTRDSSDLLDQFDFNELENSRKFEDLRSRLNTIIAREALKRLELANTNDNTNAPSDSSSYSTENIPSNELDENASVLSDSIRNRNSETNNPILKDENGGPPIKTTQILAQPVDQLALANSLFLSNENELAFDLYSKLANENRNDELSFWIEFQTANCLRRLGQFDEANLNFRKVTNSTSTDITVEMSRWWLERVEHKKRISGSVQAIDELIQSMENEEWK